MSPRADSPPFVHHSVPNRSLGNEGRRVFLAAIAVTTMGVAAFAAALGAWPVMPFAGLEVGLVVLAFRVLAAHDGDFEHLEIGAGEVKVDSRCARSVTHVVFNQPWARVVVRERGDRCTLGLAYAGRTVPIGRLMSDEGRRDLARRLRGRIAVTAS
ncbi:MAG TPA: DUF2244 domain-containing protein [Usitatibacter sp.]|nr:DUF2244 domain-containing protein [Usitatibacter sp.]